MMNYFKYYLWLFVSVIMATSCSDDDSFTTSSNNLLTFSVDTIRMDTVFSKVPTSRRSLWVYNKSGDGIRCTSVRLVNGNRSGFRVNVDGTYLGKESGYQTSDVEIRNKDSIFINIELTSPQNNKIGPQYMEDDLVFVLESEWSRRLILMPIPGMLILSETFV